MSGQSVVPCLEQQSHLQSGGHRAFEEIIRTKSQLQLDSINLGQTVTHFHTVAVLQGESRHLSIYGFT